MLFESFTKLIQADVLLLFSSVFFKFYLLNIFPTIPFFYLVSKAFILSFVFFSSILSVYCYFLFVY